jgi:hypothetical protein
VSLRERDPEMISTGSITGCRTAPSLRKRGWVDVERVRREREDSPWEGTTGH